MTDKPFIEKYPMFQGRNMRKRPMCDCGHPDCPSDGKYGLWISSGLLESILDKHFVKKNQDCDYCKKPDQYSDKTLCKYCFLKWVKLEKTYIEKQKVKDSIDEAEKQVEGFVKLNEFHDAMKEHIWEVASIIEETLKKELSLDK